MAVFKRLSQEEIKRDFTHYGWIFGIVPIYVGDPESECRLAVRNWIPEFTLDFFEVLFGAFMMIALTINPNIEPQFKIKITGEI